jgi:hypothetical protein
MKRLLLSLAILLGLSGAAEATCTLPFTLLNGTLADASQVMADFNAVVTCLNAAQVAGPGASSVGNIATWNNTTGSLLADSGITALSVKGSVVAIPFAFEGDRQTTGIPGKRRSPIGPPMATPPATW